MNIDYGGIDVGDEADAEMVAKVAEVRNIEDLRNLRQILLTKPGREFVWAVLEQTGFFGSSFSGEKPLTAAWLSGKREVGAWLFQRLHEADPFAFAHLSSENADRVVHLMKEGREKDD